MKKVLLAALALFTFTSAMALDNEPKPGLTWQGQVGLDISNLRGSHFDAKPGANLGFYGQYMFEKAHGTYLFAGVDYAMKGAKHDMILEKGTIKNKLHYIDVPVHIGFQYNIIPELGVFADFGPYFGVGVGGRNSFDFESDGIPDFHKNIYKDHYNGTYGNGIDKYDAIRAQRFDWGLGFRVGAEYNQHYSINFAFDWGLVDILKDDYRSAYFKDLNSSLPNYKTFNTAITLGYRF